MSSDLAPPGTPAIPPADRAAPPVRALPVQHANSSLVVRPEAALAWVTETLISATADLKAKWDRARDALHRQHQNQRDSVRKKIATIATGVEQLHSSPEGVCVQCNAAIKRGSFCSQKCASKFTEAGNARLAHLQHQSDETIDRETAELDEAAQAEIHRAETRALQPVDRRTLKAALAASYEKYHAACRKYYEGDTGTYEDWLEIQHLLKNLKLLDEAWDRLLWDEREERVARTGGCPPRYCKVCFIPTLEHLSFCSMQCERHAEAGKDYRPTFMPGLFRCEWCRLYFKVRDPDMAGISDVAPFCSRACLEASAADLEEHEGMDFSGVKRMPPPPPSVEGRQRMLASYLQRFIADQSAAHTEDLRPLALGQGQYPEAGISVPARRSGAAGSERVHSPNPIAAVRDILLARLVGQTTAMVRPLELIEDLSKRLGYRPSPESVGGWLRAVGAQRLTKDRVSARYSLVVDHLRP
jgi:hypothetical protein